MAMLMLTKRSLMHVENLTLPSVIILSANMDCSNCQDKVSQLLTKITVLEECIVDVSNQQVIMKGEIKYSSTSKSKSFRNKTLNPFKLFICFLRAAFIRGQ